MDLTVQRGVPLSSRCTLGLGGDAEYFTTAHDDAQLERAVRWARERDAPLTILGGGSNMVIGDEGVAGLVVEMAQRGVQRTEQGDTVHVTAMAGERWDPLVARVVGDDLAGLECLSGIPGLVGAVPIQNVGAYGQEVSETIESVRVLDRQSLEVLDRSVGDCEFSYRDSAFRREPGRFIVLAVRFALRRGGAAALRYSELQARVDGSASLARVRDVVLELRRAKSMVIDPTDENRRSAGSFFTNPIVEVQAADRVQEIALEAGIIERADQMPRYPAPHGAVKLAAGWLIERAGFERGLRRGTVGISSRHALALVHHGGGTTAELLGLAREVRDQVRKRFGVELTPEPTFVGVAL